jgi:hypothetical protein
LRLAKPAISTTELEEAGEAKPAISTAGNGVGRKSQCEPLAEVIKAKVERGLSAHHRLLVVFSKPDRLDPHTYPASRGGSLPFVVDVAACAR